MCAAMLFISSKLFERDTAPPAGVKLLVYEALSLKLLVYEALSLKLLVYEVLSLKLLVYEALSYYSLSATRHRLQSRHTLRLY